MKTKVRLLTSFVILGIVTLACGGPAAVRTLTPNSTDADISTEEPLPDEKIGIAEIDWKKGLADPSTASLAIVAIGGVALDPVALILIAGVATYVVVSNPEL